MDVKFEINILRYDDTLMDNIAQQYNGAAVIVDEIITELDTVGNVLLTAYDGMATEYLLPELFIKLVEHMNFLKICYTATGTYVTDCKETLHVIDDVMEEKLGINIG